MSLHQARRLFSVIEYDRMISAGVFSADDRLELIDGEIVEMSPIGTRHAACVCKLTQCFSSRLGDRALLSVQNPVEIGGWSKPQPDIVLLAPKTDYYVSESPTPKDLLLLVEVADTSRDFDTRVKLPLYANGDVTEVWLIDLTAEEIAVCTQPIEGSYHSRRSFRRGDAITPTRFPDVSFPVDDLLP